VYAFPAHDPARRAPGLDGPSLRRRNKVARKRKARRRLVDANLDRAGGIKNGDAERARAVQHIEAQRDAFECARSYRADKDRVGQRGAKAGNDDTARPGGIKTALRKPDGDESRACAGEGGRKLPGVPIINVDR